MIEGEFSSVGSVLDAVEEVEDRRLSPFGVIRLSAA